MNCSISTVLSLAIAGVCIGRANADAQTPTPIRLAANKHDEHKGSERELASQEIAGYTVKVIQESDVKAGEEAAFAVMLSGKDEKPKAVRGWVGVQDAEGSVKGKAVAEGEAWHAHVEVPNPIPAKSQFWVEIETSAGKKKAAFDYK